MNRKRLLPVLLAVVLLLAAIPVGFAAAQHETAASPRSGMTGAVLNTSATSTAQPKYVFLFIGDGMTYPQFQTASAYLSINADKDTILSTNEMLNFMKFPVSGSATTYDSTSFCPDSASTATSIASGYKTYSGVLNMNEAKNKTYTTIAESLKANTAYKIGIISTVNLNHATPAAFYAHQPSRNNYYEIGLELIDSGFDYFAGGALLKATGNSSDKPQTDLYELAAAAGYKVVKTQAEAQTLTAAAGKAIVIAEDLADSNSMNYEIDRDASAWALKDYVQQGIAMLKSDSGFFMAIESGKIDWACHANDAAAALADTLAFDQAVAVAARFATSRPGQVLVVVTGDHECGGLTLSLSGTRPMAFPAVLRHQRMSLQRFADEVLPGFARGPGQGRFEALLPLLGELFGLGADGAAPLALDADELETLRAAFVRSRAGGGPEPAPGGYDPLAVALGSILGRKAGLGWTSQRHSGVPVSTSALGVGQERFSGAYDNAALGRTLLALMGLGPGPALPVYAASLRTVPSVLP